MPNIGPLELAIVLVIVLLIFGPKRLPGLGRQLGSGMREFKDSLTGKGRDDDDEEEGAAELPAAPKADPQRDAGAVRAPETEVVSGEARPQDQPATRVDS